MKSSRFLLTLLALLSVAVVVLSVRVVQLRRKVAHAELYVQLGSDNWVLACSSVAKGLRTYGNDPEAAFALKSVAYGCIGRSDYTDDASAQMIADDFTAKDVNSLVKRIERAIDTRDYFLPPVNLTGRFPKGYDR